MSYVCQCVIEYCKNVINKIENYEIWNYIREKSTLYMFTKNTSINTYIYIYKLRQLFTCLFNMLYSRLS